MILQKMHPEADISEAENGQIFLAKAMDNKPDLVFMDIHMPVMDGFEATDLIMNKYPDLKIICISMHDNYEYKMIMERKGASAFLVKGMSRQQLAQTIESVMQNNKCFDA
jgi:DNA-binding NarL/FixJ family response regulator